jgi:hypothetical protein
MDEERRPAIDVGGGSDGGQGAAGLFGRHVTWRAHDCPRARLARIIFEALGQAKIADLGDPVGERGV